MRSEKIKKITFAALFAALIAVCTLFTSIRIPGTTSGYVHIGDAFIFLAGAMLPMPYAVAAAAIGGALADTMAAAYIYIPATFVIKALMAACFFRSGRSIVSGKSVLSAIFAIIVLVGGYYIAEVIMFGSFVAPVVSVLWNAAQGVFSAAAFFVIGAALDAANVKSRINLQ